MCMSLEELNERFDQLNIKIDKLLHDYEAIRDEETHADRKMSVGSDAHD